MQQAIISTIFSLGPNLAMRPLWLSYSTVTENGCGKWSDCAWIVDSRGVSILQTYSRTPTWRPAERFPAYLEREDLPFFLWLRLVVGQKLTDLHRHHLGVQQRDASRDVSLYQGPMPQATSFALAAQLLGKMTTPSRAAIRAESKLQIQEALNAMDPIDREVLTLRHFEMLTNAETAKVLDLSQAAASNRYIRALKRMKEILEEVRGENS